MVGEQIAKLASLLPNASIAVETQTLPGETATALAATQNLQNPENGFSTSSSQLGQGQPQTPNQSLKNELATLLGLGGESLKMGTKTQVNGNPAFDLNRQALSFQQNLAGSQSELLAAELQQQAGVQNNFAPTAKPIASIGDIVTENELLSQIALGGGTGFEKAGVMASQQKDSALPTFAPEQPATQKLQPQDLGLTSGKTFGEQTSQNLASFVKEGASTPLNMADIATQGAHFAKQPKEFSSSLEILKNTPQARGAQHDANTPSLTNTSANNATALSPTLGMGEEKKNENNSSQQENGKNENGELPKFERAVGLENSNLKPTQDLTENKPTPTMRAETAENMSKGAMHRAVQTAARLQAQGGGSARIQINDTHLGSIDLRVTVSAGQNVHVEIKSKDQKLRNSLESRMDDLRSSLGQHNLNLSECRVVSETAQARNETENRNSNGGQTFQQQGFGQNSSQNQNSHQGRDNTVGTESIAARNPIPKNSNPANIAPKTNIQRGANGSLKVTA
jgi:flagellar hook-length control protein FliK